MGDGILTAIQGEPKWKDLILANEPLTSWLSDIHCNILVNIGHCCSEGRDIGIYFAWSLIYSWFATVWQGGRVGVKQSTFFWKIYVKIKSSVPSREKCFCSWHLTWQPWCQGQTSNTHKGERHSLIPVSPFLLSFSCSSRCLRR